jgi:hypothetical protein
MATLTSTFDSPTYRSTGDYWVASQNAKNNEATRNFYASLNQAKNQKTLASLLGGSAVPTAMPTATPQVAPQIPQAAQLPHRFEAGLSANEARLNALLTDPSSIQQTAAYKFRVGQGQEAIQRQMAAKGMLGSGNRLMELTKYGQDMGSQEYDKQADRLSSLVGNYSGSWIGDKNANTANQAMQNQYTLGMGNLDVARGGLALRALQQGTNQDGGLWGGSSGGYSSSMNPVQQSPFSVFQ